MVGIFMNYLSKIFVVLFLLIDDIGRLIRWVVQKVQLLTNSAPVEAASTPQGEPITRSEFLMKTAVIAGTVPAVAMTWGFCQERMIIVFVK
jgi:hypothetical protein